MSAQQTFSPDPVAVSSNVMEAAPRPWKLSWFLRASAALHVGAFIALVQHPGLWHWPVGLLVADHLVILANVMSPRSRLFGPNLTRLAPQSVARREVAITFDDGPDAEVTPRVLDLLDRHGARATFFCVAERAQALPEVVDEIVRRGHEVQNHSFGHAYSFPARGVVAMRRDIGRAQHVLRQLTGRAPVFFRAPMGFRSPMLEPALAPHGLNFVSWTRRGFDTRESDATRVLERLTRGLAAGDILLLHDRNSARTSSSQPVVLEVLPALLQRLSADRLVPVTLTQALRVEGAKSV